MLMKTQPCPGMVRPSHATRAFELAEVAGHPKLAGNCKDFASATGPTGASLSFDPEQRVFARGASGGVAFMIECGLVRFERMSEAGNRRITRIAGRGDLIGQEALLKQAYRDDTVACTPVRVHRISASLLDDEDWQPRRLSIALMDCWQKTLDEAEFWSTEMATGSSRRRVLQLLSRLHQHRDDHGLIWLPKRDQMGDMLNMTLETCSRVLSALSREGVLVRLPPRQAVLNEVRLGKAVMEANH